MEARRFLPKAIDIEKVKALSEWHSLYRAYNGLFKVQETALIPHGISLPQLQVLTLLARHRRPITISELARWMVKEPNSLTGLVDRVEAKGWVRTHGDAKDRRKRLVEFTREGVKKFEEAFPVANKANETVFSGLGAAEMDKLRAYCEKLSDAAGLRELKSRGK